MFDEFLRCYNAISEADIENPLLETLRLYDLLSQGSLRKMNTLLEQENIDLPMLVQERRNGMPLEYILKKAIFMNIEFYCSPATLIPREETELLFKVALKIIGEQQKSKKELTIVDVGTGCGNLTISLIMNTNHTKALASDISAEAIKVAQKNIEKYELSERVALFCGDGLSPFDDAEYAGKIDVVVCNPPYIPTVSLDKLASEIADYEPRVAFDGGPYGMGFLRKLITGAASVLKPMGTLIFEIGVGQEKLATRLLERSKAFDNIDYFTDDKKQIRVISATKLQ